MSGHFMDFAEFGTRFEVERLRRERHELIGELTVKCELPGALCTNGALSVGDMNFSSVQSRSTRAKLLGQRARTNGEMDWFGMVERFSQYVIKQERDGEPAQNIWSIPVPEKMDDFAVAGIALPRKHPSILFGDGGSAKSYTALWIAGKLSLQGIPVALFDWELSGDEHRERFERLFGDKRPPLTYCRCDNAITSEADRIARVVRENSIVYAIFDSISFAVNGPPEAAETAGAYFRVVRCLNIGSLHIAHVNKGEDGDKKPFGSAFWYNGARSIWYVKADEPNGHKLDLGFYHRKANTGPLRHPVKLSVSFGSEETVFEKGDMSDSPGLAEKMTVRQRIYEILGRGALTFIEIAEQLDEKVDTVRKAVKRSPQLVIIQGKGSEQDKVGIRARVV